MNKLDFNIRESSLESKKPLIIMVHGFGANKNDLFGLKNFFDEKIEIISLQAPNEMLHGGRHWYNIEWTGNKKRVDTEEAKKSKELLHEFVKEQKDSGKYSQIILLGFSQGSILSHAVTYENPDLVDILIAFSGYLDTNIFEFSSNVKTEIFMSHGMFDEVIEVEHANKASEILKEKNIEHFYKVYPLAHSIDENILKDLLIWLNGKIK